jgi:hypothetical protein
VSELALPGLWLPPKPEIVVPKIALGRRRWWWKARDVVVPAVALDQSLGQGNRAAGGTCTMTTTAAAASGSIIIIAIGAFRAGSLTSFTMSGGGLTWATDQFLTAGNIRASFASAKAPSGLASGTVLTATPVPAGNCDWIIGGGSFTGIDTSGTILTGTNSSSGTGTAHTSGSITANAGDLLVECSFNDGNGTATSTPTNLELFDKAVGAQTETLTFTYKLGMAATDSTGGTWSASITHVDVGASYLAAGGAAAAGRPAQSRRIVARGRRAAGAVFG